MDTGRPQRSCKKTTFYREDFWVPETRTKKQERTAPNTSAGRSGRARGDHR